MILDYEIEKIADYRIINGQQVVFQVKWVGYPGMTWEPFHNLDNCWPILADFFFSLYQKSKIDYYCLMKLINFKK